MTVNIEEMRVDMAHQREALEKQLASETRRFLVSAIIALAAAVGVGIGNYLTPRAPAAFQLPPGTVITAPQPRPHDDLRPPSDDP